MTEGIESPPQPDANGGELAHIAEPLRPLAVLVDSLTPDPSNARTHSTRNLDIIAGSLKKFGQVKPLVCDAHGVIVAGNGSWQAARQLGWKYIAAVRTNLEGATAAAFGIADNRASDTSDWDNDALATLLASLKAEDELLAATGFDPGEVEKLLREAGGGGEIPADAAGTEYTEAVADNVKTIPCPHCGQLVPLPT